jgi:(p)ppGpp synthase/HD superfamily hydrolase
MLEKAISIAAAAHAGMVDKVGQPYILHPLRVMFRCEGENERIVAVLHDVIEDTTVTWEDLGRAGFSQEVLAALECVTKRKGESYEEFVGRAAADPVARRVKLADLEDNMDVRRLMVVSEEDCARLAKYLKAWRRLKQA